MNRAPLVGLALAGALSPCAAWAFTAFADPVQNGKAVRWAGPTVLLTIQQDGVDDVTDGSDVAAVERAAASWNAHLQGLQLTTTRSAARGYGEDGVNRVTFLETGWISAADGALGATINSVTHGTPSRMTDADVLLNGTLGPWSTTGSTLAIDVQSVATHELGHLVGLGHTFDATASMYWSTRKGSTNRAVLAADDQRAARFSSQDNASCTADQDCPLLVVLEGGTTMRLRCVEGSCVQGLANYGMDCLDNSHCASGLCLADRSSGAGPGACTQSCGAAACPNGDACTDPGSGPVCAPQRGCFQDSDCGGGANDKCLLLVDGTYRCTPLCSRNANCPDGNRCVNFSYGAGICLAPGSAPNGSPCQDPQQCAGLACLGTGTPESRTCATAGPNSPLDAMDGGTPVDAAVPPVDAAIPPRDAGGITQDAAPLLTDGSVPAGDGSVPPEPDAASGGTPQDPPDDEAPSLFSCRCAASTAPGHTAWMWGGLLLLVRRTRGRSP